MDVDALIARLQAGLAEHRPGYFAQLQPGVDDAALDAFEQRFGLALPPAFRALYRWRNGQAVSCNDNLEGNRMFSSLEDIADTKDIFDGMIGADFEGPDWWRLGWVPFLANGGGSHLCVDVAAAQGGQPGQLIAYWKGDADRSVEHESIEAWLTEHLAAMKGSAVGAEWRTP